MQSTEKKKATVNQVNQLIKIEVPAGFLVALKEFNSFYTPADFKEQMFEMLQLSLSSPAADG